MQSVISIDDQPFSSSLSAVPIDYQLQPISQRKVPYDAGFGPTSGVSDPCRASSTTLFHNSYYVSSGQ